MLWILLAILAHFFWAIVGLGDKYMVAKQVKDYLVYIFLMTAMGLIFLLLIPFTNFYIPDKNILFWLSLAAAFYLFGGIPYIKALQMEEASRISIWWNLVPVFSFLIGWFFLQESFTLIQAIAFVLLLVGACLASIHARQRKIVFSKAVWLMMLAGFAFAFYGVILHYLMSQINFILVFIWLNILMIIFSLSFFISKSFRFNLHTQIKNANNRLWYLLFIFSFINSVGIFFNQWALVYTPASLAFSFEGFQTVFVFVLAMLLTLFFPKIIKEEIDKKNLILKIIAVLFMLAGIYVLSFS